ncbi:MAG: prolyl oligopeptidase family serine peptidase [Gemmatimonadales bacterium]|nr:prolyl oligopeptidase family serine peptidase [Gemmatimonadales bacterium]NIN10191.1 prolyl oligopeptidase family serine peptidase [Gemmatimonadales bacterium]NIN48947.1 prolyl oligopeptidase family serine peptidase [Gemmatimonadales bacterium]NIP06411.1 prolyl oligopeptidase family serine peptidase [Gemmatimonadales bacterium]NIQ98763.1 prolyl oligopeptidase family serine peptidase [Gemmatimonadales bacterium]
MNALNRVVFALVAVTVAVTLPTDAQILQQSSLTPADRDPSFQLTIEHLGEDLRWLGLAPRQIRWSPDGRWIYFRWREDPEPGQTSATDPWYAVNRAGTEARVVSDEEVALIPQGNIQWSRRRDVAVWSNSGTIFVWTRSTGTRPVYTSSRSVGNLRLSPEGNRIHFSTQGFSGSLERGDTRQNGDLWVYDRSTGQARQVAVARSKDEKKKSEAGEWLENQQLELIDIVRRRKRNREIADSVSRARGPERPQTIPVEQGSNVRNFRLSPDGRFVTFQWIKNPAPQHRTSYMEFVNESGYAAERRARPKVGEPMFSAKMGIVRVDPTVHPDSVAATWVDDGIEKETIVHGPYWSPTGEHAVVQILSLDHKDRWLALLDIETGQVTVIDHQDEDAWIGGPLVGGRWGPGWLQWLPDGSAFGFASTATGWAMLYLAEVDGTVSQLTDGEWEVRGAELSPDGKTWYLRTSQHHPGEEHIYHLPVHGGELTRLSEGEGMYRAYPSPDGRRLAVTYETVTQMADLYVRDNRRGASARRVTKSGTDEFYRYAWAPSEIVTFPDPAGEETWGEIWQPPEQHNGAAVIYVHGCGECGQGIAKGWRRVRTRLYANYLRQLGYLAANLDFRGSAGYGHANRTYAYRQMGVSDVDTGLPFLDLLVERYGVDRNRFGIYGGSYGGFFTIMSLFRHPGKYAAGVALYPVTDWAHYNQGYTNRILNGAPYEDEEAYRVSSPVYYAEGLQDALQIQHGLVDGNVQIQDSFRLSQILMEMNKDFDLVVYPMEDHGWNEVPSRRDSYKRMTRWFDQHLLGETRRAASEGSK